MTVNRFATSIDPVHCLVGVGMLDGAGGHPQFRKDGRCVREWGTARNQFAILYPERFNFACFPARLHDIGGVDPCD